MKHEKTTAILWTIFCLVGGSWTITHLFKTNREITEFLYPLSLALWATIFFLGRTILGKILMYFNKIKSKQYQ